MKLIELVWFVGVYSAETLDAASSFETCSFMFFSMIEYQLHVQLSSLERIKIPFDAEEKKLC